MLGTMDLSRAEVAELARTIRKDVIMMTCIAGSGHPGGPLSAADYCAELIANHLRLDPEDPYNPERDRFIISNGHCSALNFSLLSRRGFFSPGYLLTFRQTQSRLQGHPNHCKLPGIEIGTGSLGQGLSVAHGMALGARLDGKHGVRVVCNVGDGELQEGQCWEAVMHAGHRGTDNLIMCVDYNDAQIDGRVTDVKRIDPLGDKLTACHWDVHECNGHKPDEVEQAWQWAFERVGQGKPLAIVFHTIMMQGTGGEYEDIPGWHGRPPKPEEALAMLKVLGYEYASIEAAVDEYGDQHYDGKEPPLMGADWTRIIHPESCDVVAVADER